MRRQPHIFGMRTPRHVRLLGLACLALAACGVVNVERYYTPETSQTFPPTRAVAVINGGEDAEAAYRAEYAGPGYQRIGRVSFVGQHADDASMVEFAKRIGADLVVISRRVAGSRVVDNPLGPRDYSLSDTGTNIYGAIEPQFDLAYSPILQGSSTGPTSYVVRDYRQVAIFLRRAG